MRSVAEDEGFAAHMADVMKALGHPVRLRAVALLCGGGDSVNSLAGRLGVTQAVLSQQLRILRMGGLVEVERKDGFSVYRLAEPQLGSLVDCLGTCTLYDRERV